MIFIQAFIASGLLCLLGQFLCDLSKLKILKVLIIIISLGAIVTAVGLIGYLVDFGMAGVIMNIFGLGEAAFSGFAGLLNGEPMGLITFTILLICIFLVSILFGVVKNVNKDIC